MRMWSTLHKNQQVVHLSIVCEMSWVEFYSKKHQKAMTPKDLQLMFPMEKRYKIAIIDER